MLKRSTKLNLLTVCSFLSMGSLSYARIASNQDDLKSIVVRGSDQSKYYLIRYKTDQNGLSAIYDTLDLNMSSRNADEVLQLEQYLEQTMGGKFKVVPLKLMQLSAQGEGWSGVPHHTEQTQNSK